MRRFAKISLWVLTIIATLFLVLILSVSPVAKYLVNHYGKDWTGRKIQVSGVRINLLSGRIFLNDLKVFEPDDQTLHLSVDTLLTRVNEPGIISGIYEISQVRISGLKISVVQNGKLFNHDDLLQRFMPADTGTRVPEQAPGQVKYRLKNLAMANSSITYRDMLLGNEVSLTGIDISIPLIAYDEPELNLDYGLGLNGHGRLAGLFSLDQEKSGYSLTIKADGLNLELLLPYLKEYLNITSFRATLGSNLLAKGNLNRPGILELRGRVNISRFGMTDREGRAFVAWDGLLIDADSISTGQNRYDFSKIWLDRPYFLFEQYREGNNLASLAGSEEQTDTSGIRAGTTTEYSNPFNILIAYLNDFFYAYLSSNYTADSLVVSNGRVVYTDYSLERKFRYEISDLGLLSTNMNSASSTIPAKISATLNQGGRLNAEITLNPADPKELDFRGTIEQAAIPDFNPYTLEYVAVPFISGRLSFTSEISIHDEELISNNQLLILKPGVGKKINNPDAYKVPVKLAVSVLKDLKGNIELEVPVRGRLNDPEYKIGKAIWKVLENIMLKAATAPLKLVQRAMGNSSDDLSRMPFDYLSRDLDKNQLSLLDRLGKMLTAKPELDLIVIQEASRETEQELLATELARKRYYLDMVLHRPQGELSPEESTQAVMVSTHDSLFTAYLAKKTGNPGLPVLKQCIQLAGTTRLEETVDSLRAARENRMKDYLITKIGLAENRIVIRKLPDESSRPVESPGFIFEVGVKE